jgi:hypothetical protein
MSGDASLGSQRMLSIEHGAILPDRPGFEIPMD